MVSGFAAPAMAARLMGLDRVTLANALALSGARAPTPLVVRHGAISAAKSVANALIAQNAMQATLLAQHGMTGPLDLFENPHGLGSLFPAPRRLADRAADGRLLPDGLPRQSLSLPRHRPVDRACGARHPPAGRRRCRQARPHHGRDRRHAVAPPAEGRSRPHRSDLARGRRPQLQFPRRGADRRRRLRPRPVRRRRAGTHGRCATSWGGWRSSATHR